jgi:hypothetical protein
LFHNGFQLKKLSKSFLKKFFKTNTFFFWFHSAKLNLNQWIYLEQNLKKLKLSHSKVLNTITSKLFQNSIFENLRPAIRSFVSFVIPNFKTTELRFSSMKKNFKPSFELILIKLNNKIYAPSQLKGLNTFSYRKNMFNLYESLDQHLKTSYTLTKKK